MSIVQNVLIGRARKSIGNAVLYTMNGQNILRSKPGTFKPPDTQDYKNRTNRFKAGNELASKIKHAAANLIIPAPIHRTAYSKLTSFCILAFNIVANTPVFAPKDKACAKGTLPFNGKTSLTAVSGYSIDIEYSKDLISVDEKDTDEVFILLTNETGTKAQFIHTGSKRIDGEASFHVPPYMQGDKVFVSAPIFISADGRFCSDSVFSESSSPLGLIP